MQSNLDPNTPPDRAGLLRNILSDICGAERDLEDFAVSVPPGMWPESQGAFDQLRTVIDGFYDLFRNVRDGNRN